MKPWEEDALLASYYFDRARRDLGDGCCGGCCGICGLVAILMAAAPVGLVIGLVHLAQNFM